MNASPALRDGASPALEGGGAAVDIPVVGPTEPYLPERNGEDMATVTELRPATESDATQPLPLAADTDGDIEEHQEAVGSASAVAPVAVSNGDQPDFTRPVAVTVAAASAPRPQPTELRIKQVKPVSAPKPVPAQQAAPTTDVDTPTFWQALKHRIAGTHTKHLENTDEEAEPPSLPMLIINGVLAVAATAAAFILSYTMLLLVIKATGWTGMVARIGPLVPDVAALAAAVMLVAQTKKALGWTLLLGSTGMSIVGNLAGHAIERTTAGPQHGGGLPGSWSLVGDAFSVFMPVVMAFLVHAFMEQLAAFLAWRKRQNRQRQEQQRQAQERRERAAAAQAARQEALESLPKPQRKNEQVSKDVAVQYGIAYEAYTPARLGQLLTEARWAPRGETAMKDYCKAIKKELGIV